MTDHILKKIDVEIASLRAHVLALADQVKVQLNDATTLIEKCYMERGVSVDKLEERINELQVAIDRECLQFIALHKPSAGDLRNAVSMMRIVTDLEAIGNATVQIARSGERIHRGAKREVPAGAELSGAFAMLKSMLLAAIEGFERIDAHALTGLARSEVELARRLDGVCNAMAEAIADGGGDVKVQLEVIDIARTTNLVGNLCQSIGAHIAFIVQGNDLRHASVAAIERSLAGS